MPAEGFTCNADGSAETCTKSSTDTKYGVEVGETVLVRDGMFIRVSQANISTPDLLQTLVSDVWQ